MAGVMDERSAGAALDDDGGHLRGEGGDGRVYVGGFGDS